MYSVNSTYFGVVAILIWSTFSAFIRTITESFGVLAGTALIYTIGAIFLCLCNKGVPNLKKFRKKYLLLCGALFVIYELLLSAAIGLADTRQQSIEVSLINYLWPSLVVLLSLFINKQRVNLFLFLPGIILSFLGVAWSISDGQGFNVTVLISHIKLQPVPYILALIAAFLWGFYCNLSKRFNNGNNGIPLFFIVIAIVLWIEFWFSSETLRYIDTITVVIEVIIIGALIGISYSFWETGIQKGNMLLLAILSYFTPALSVLFSSFWLNTSLTLSFWYGVSMVILGSLLCWIATKKS